LTKLVREQRAAERVVIASEIAKVVHAVKREQPGWLFSGTAGQLLARVFLGFARLDGLAPVTGGVLMIPEVHKGLKVLTPRFLQQAHARGERVWVFVVEQLSDLTRLREMGVDGVFTPFPTAFSQQLNGARSVAA
jgi:glycerophosphoryl diester phosphodiesterase